ncbi:hypothetical protein Tco_0083826 [Tanacetum coccineum]
MVVHKDADLKESDPPAKKPKVTFEMLTPIQSVMPPAFTNIPFYQFAENLFKTKESKFSPSPPRHDIQDKGKGIVEPNKDDQIKMIMPLVDEGGSNPDLLELKKFRGTRERPMTIEEAKQQMEEPKRLSDIKKSEEESKKALKKMSLAKRQAQRHKLKEIEAKREKLRDEYFKRINERTSPEKITKTFTLFFPHLEFESHYRYGKGTSSLGLWYPKGSGFDLKGYSDSDYAGCFLDRKNTSGSCQILGGKEFWYSAEVDTTTNTVSFNLSCHSKTLSFNLHDFAKVLGLDVSADTITIPKKEIIKEALGTLGLVDENDLYTSSKDLINKPPVKVKNKNLKPFLAHQITDSSFGTPFENEVPMTSHMYNVVGLPNESLIPSPQKVNADESFDKSPSKTSPLVDTIMGDDEPIIEKVQETSNDDMTKDDFSKPESIPDDEFMDFTEDVGIAESEEETRNIHASAEQPSQTTTSLTPIPFPSMQNVQELWVKEIWKSQYNKPTSSVLVNKEVVSTITSLSAKVRDLGDIIGTSAQMAVENSVNSLLPKLINDLLISKLPEALTSCLSQQAPQLVSQEVKENLPEFSESVSEVLKDQKKDLKSSLKSTIKRSIKSQLDKVVDLFKCSFGHHLQLLSKTSKDMTELVELVTRVVALINPIPSPAKANIEGEKEQKTEETPSPTPAETTNEVPTKSNAPTQGEPEEIGPAKNLTMVVHKDADLKESDPPAKKPKVTFKMLTPIQSVMPPAFTDIPFS